MWLMAISCCINTTPADSVSGWKLSKQKHPTLGFSPTFQGAVICWVGVADCLRVGDAEGGFTLRTPRIGDEELSRSVGVVRRTWWKGSEDQGQNVTATKIKVYKCK